MGFRSHVIGLLIALLVLASPLFGQESPPAASKPAGSAVGWRGDGTGRYPDATPPLEWARWPKSPVHDMAYAIAKPKDDSAGDAKPLYQGMIKRWLLVGPFDADPSGLAKEYIAGEADLEPVEGQKAGELEWRPLEIKKRESDAVQGTELEWVYFSDVIDKKADQYAYAFAWLYSQTDGKIVFVVDHAKALKAWVNGKEVYSAAKPNLSLWATNNMSWAQGQGIHPPFGPVAKRAEVAVRKGWNRVLLKANANVHLRLTPEPGVAYEGKNVVYAAELPDYSNASPIVVGERIFVMAEPDELVCVNKKDGKVLWRRTNHFFDTVTEDERKANPAYAEKVAPLMEKRLAAKTWGEKIVLGKQLYDALVAIDKDRFTMNIEAHPTGHRPLAGWTTPTPISDGKFVYAFVGNGVAACYDLDGNRKWTQRVDLALRNPEAKDGPYQYPCSGLLIDGKFIAPVLYHGIVALNAADGSIAWKNPEVKSSMICLNAAKIGGADCILGTAGEVIRASDGKVLWANKWNSSSGPGVYDNGMLYMLYLGCVAVDLAKCTPDDCKPTVTPFARAPGVTSFTAPLSHDRMVYYAGRESEFVALGTKGMALAYQKKLDSAPLLNYLAAGMCSAPTLGGKNIYQMDNQGVTFVIEPGPEFKQLARNRIETYLERDFPIDPLETTYSNPVFDGKSLYIRAEKFLYRIEQGQ